MSERRACRLSNQPRGTQRYHAIRREDEDSLTQAIIQLASQYVCYGYRRITALLKRAGWRAGKDRVERIWRCEGQKEPQKQKPRGRLWLNDAGADEPIDGGAVNTAETFRKASKAFLYPRAGITPRQRKKQLQTTERMQLALADCS
jgi:hypothetical protein